ncbi:hypothetical protein P43SY_011703 [Pythium insidiosum]|uniref:Retrotransposon gag domain-containing protein n=1 Tax=Pythium insidiosum TaxID=114742 RepID=A0AAD5Q2Y2_PYTIN|nr:hypothetical protein P43SY_011703 [Pythium insidiosum]
MTSDPGRRTPSPVQMAQPAGHATVMTGSAGLPLQTSAYMWPVRPFIPHRALELFDGKGPISERRAWWKEFQYLGHSGAWTDAEKCHNLEMYLRGVAESWFQQLGELRRSWPRLAEAFRNEFCVPTQSAVEKYFSLKQRRGETPRQHLWRLNATAKKARIRLTTPADLKHHVGRFLKTLTDSEVRTVLIGRTFKTLEDLDATLKAYEEHASYGDDPRSRSTPSRERERSVPRSGQVYYTYDSDQEASWDREPKTVRFKVDDRYDDDSDADDLEDDTEVIFQASGASA